MSRYFSQRPRQRVLGLLAAFLISIGRLEWQAVLFILRLARGLFFVATWPLLFVFRLVKLLVNLPLLFKSLSVSFKNLAYYFSSARQAKAELAREQKLLKRSKRQSYWSQLKAEPRRMLFKPALAFALFALVIITPLKFYDTLRFFERLEAKITNFAQAAVGQLNQGKEAAMASDFQVAHTNFSAASQDFVKAGEELAGVDGLLVQLLKVAPSQKLKMAASGQKLVLAGQLGSGLAADLSESASALLTERSDKNLSQVLTAFSVPGERALYKLQQLTPVLAEINSSDLPANYQPAFAALKDKAALLSSSLKALLDITEQLQVFLGRDIDKRYLLVFQNNTEARASGGFMGSFAIIDFKQGQIKKIQSPGGGTYDTEGGLRRLVAAPQPLWLVNPLWHLWDANWWPDWARSARKIMWFYEKSDGSTVDGVISLTPNVVIRLLKVIGPIDLRAKHGVIITADNFLDTVQAIAEQKADVTNEPKQIIGDMLSAIMDKMSALHHEDYLEIVKVLETSLNEKDILLYFTDPSLQAKLGEMGWDGAVKSTNGDYLAVINTNIAGGKSDKKIVQTVTHQASVTSDGAIIDTVTIVRDHQAIKREPFSGVRNVDWLRVYTPLGSRLISSSGWRQPEVKIESPDPSWEADVDLTNEASATRDELTGTLSYREDDKTVFANWSMVDPGELAVVKLVYKLPFKISLTNNSDKEPFYKYTLLVQKQAGAHNSQISSALLLPDNFNLAWNYPEQNTASFYEQNVDRSWAYLLSPK